MSTNIDNIIHTESKRINHLLSSKQKELEKLTTVTDNLYMDWRTGKITKAEYRRIKGKFETQIEQLQGVIEQLEQEKEALAMGVNTDEPYLTTFHKHKNISPLGTHWSALPFMALIAFRAGGRHLGVRFSYVPVAILTDVDFRNEACCLFHMYVLLVI